MKPFSPTPHKVITITIDEQGNNVFLKTDSADCFLEQGEVITRRASHVEPAPRYERWLFSLLRTLFSDTSAVAAWTRTWNTLWRINTSPVGGPILRVGHVWPGVAWPVEDRVACFANRQDAIDAEIEFLNNFFAERKIS
jgi:hypothetical protein